MRAALFLVPLAACGDDLSVAPDAGTGVPAGAVLRETITESVPLVVNEIVEAILVGGEGDYAHIKMSAAGAPIDWNLHGHANGETQVVFEELRVPAVDYVFAPAAQADWYLLLRNKGQTDITVQLEIDLYEAITWSGWQ